MTLQNCLLLEWTSSSISSRRGITVHPPPAGLYRALLPPVCQGPWVREPPALSWPVLVFPHRERRAPQEPVELRALRGPAVRLAPLDPPDPLEPLYVHLPQPQNTKWYRNRTADQGHVQGRVKGSTVQTIWEKHTQYLFFDWTDHTHNSESGQNVSIVWSTQKLLNIHFSSYWKSRALLHLFPSDTSLCLFKFW
jgi:hypothetical protein